MKVHLLETGNFKLDGGATFGVVPKTIWSKLYPADENNLCNLAMRSLFIEIKDRRILVDTGIGRKQSEKFFSYYYLNGEATLEKSLNQQGFSPEDITDVIQTHLHFDHCGGLITTGEGGKLIAAFPNARVWVSRTQWEWANHPNHREKPSFLPENYSLFAETGQLQFIEKDTEFEENMHLRLYNGHTEGMIVPILQLPETTLVFTTDLLPTATHIPLSWVCGYDIRPLYSLDEKESFLQEALENKYILVFQHDIQTECCTLHLTEKGIRPDKLFPFKALYENLPIETV